MISCTEFIPLYSEFFKYLEEKGGHNEVLKYWYHLSDTSIGDKTNPHSLAYNCEKFGGFEGALAYWGHTLTEEACDLFTFIDKNKKFRFTHMRHCPSRGMLNALRHVDPYYDYCGHCNVIYQRVLDNYGIDHVMDFSKIENAECCSLVCEKGNAPDFDFRTVSDDYFKQFEGKEGIEIIDMKSEDNKYLHRDFHLISDNAIKYCGDTFGYDEAIKFLTSYTTHYYSPQIEDAKNRGLVAVKEWIEKLYEIEEASDLLKTELSDNTLTITIEKSPVIEFAKTLNQTMSEYYIEQTRTLYKAFADACGYDFELKYYKEDGATQFVFQKK